MLGVYGIYRLPIFPRVFDAAAAGVLATAGAADFLAGGALAGAAATGLATVCFAATGFSVADFSSVPTGTFTRIVNVFVCPFVVAGGWTAGFVAFTAGTDFFAGFAGLGAALAGAGVFDFAGAAAGGAW